MPRTKANDETKLATENAAELTRRRCMLMAATEGCTQTGLADRLINEYWGQIYAGGALDELLATQLAKGG